MSKPLERQEKPLSLDTAFNLFINWMVQKNYTIKTRKNYRYPLKNLLGYLVQKGIGWITDVTLDHLQGYLKTRYYHLNAKGLQNKPATRNREIAAIRGWFKFLFANGYLAENPAEKITYIKGPKLVLPKDILTPNELVKLFALPDTGTQLGYRDRMILEILYATGMRRSELCQLKVTDLRLNDQLIRIERGKGEKGRVVPISATAIQYIQHYLAVVRPALIQQWKTRKPNQPEPSELVLSFTGRPILTDKLNDVLDRYLKHRKLKKKVSIHSLRRTIATHLIQSGMSLRLVQEFLGHDNLNTTIQYLQLNIKDLQKEYRKCHPRERDP